ncbi:MAG: hypothetical protein M3350_07145 [Actinomycetota bacterium]|nr:hypothetical protein [Actinomycetota bacterium]
MRLLAFAALVLACLLSACGTERARVADPNSMLPDSRTIRTVDFPQAGLSARVPRPIGLVRRRPPEVFRFSLPSGAIISVFAYRRKEPVPSSPSALRAARRRLVAAVRKRDRTFRVASARVVRAAGAPGVEVTGTQSLSGGRLETRSVHLFEGEGEYVLELIAPRADFGPADTQVFSPMLRSLQVTGRIRG